ncbi:hypothetical protein ElyMa_006395600 [Elysia marginata]|uniref:Uncharacterized protein n=1 Tax=Elysia marginata TaxID=1093978 RepID=A0AAV4HQ12_9GAST|nr:hypothetical protein ElyMa_006395600 [Elysia marginata]
MNLIIMLDFVERKKILDYLEELARLRERQVSETNARLDGLRAELAAQQHDWEQERRTTDSCILELQADITKLFQQNERLRFQVASYRQFKDRFSQRDVQLDEMAMTKRNQEENSGKLLSAPSASSQSDVGSSSHKRQGSQMSSDLRSLQSTGSDSIRLREDSHSLVPLTGSLAGDSGSGPELGAKDTDRKHASHGEPPAEYDRNATVAGTAAPIAIRNRSISDQDHGRLLEQTPGSQSEPDAIMMESFVMTENRSQIEMAVKQALASHGGVGDIVSVQVDLAQDSEAQGAAAADDDDDNDNDGGSDSSVVVKDGAEDEYDDIGDAMVSRGGNVDSDVKAGAEKERETEKVKDEEATEMSDKSSPSVLSSAAEAKGTPETKEFTCQGDNLNVTSDTEQVDCEPKDLVVTSDPEDSMVTSEPEELALNSEHEESIVTSEPEELALNSEHEESILTSEPEELALNSEPELLDNSNTSSDGSDTAWDMVPDSDQATVAEQSS